MINRNSKEKPSILKWAIKQIVWMDGHLKIVVLGMRQGAFFIY